MNNSLLVQTEETAIRIDDSNSNHHMSGITMVLGGFTIPYTQLRSPLKN